MQKINVIIIDDDPIAVEVIKELISYLTTDLVVVGTATNGVDAVEKISSLKPDLLFMDVEMPLMNGIEVLKQLPYQNFQLIFTTGYESEALKNTSHKAVDFLLKPIDPDEFLASVDKARKKLRFTA